MVGLKRMLRVLAPLAVACGALFAVSCGGSNNSTPSTSPTSFPTSASNTIALSSQAGVIPLSAVSPGVSTTLVYNGSVAVVPSPLPSGGFSFTSTTSSVAPANAPAPTSAKRTVLSHTNVVGVLYVSFQITADEPGNIISGGTLTLPTSLPVNQPYFVEIDDVTSGNASYINTFPGSAVTNGNSVFLHSGGFNPANDLSKIKFLATHTYLLQYYYLTTGTPATPTPSPSPSSSPAATPTPVVVATTLPLGTAQTIVLPVTDGGFVATVNLPAAGTSGTSLTSSGASHLPSGISGVGATNSLFPFYVLGFNATASVPWASPAVSLQLPTSFSVTANPIYAALCTAAACPIDGTDANGKVAPTITTAGGVTTLNYAAGAFTGFTGVGTTAQYVIFYTSRATPAGNSSSPVPIAAGQFGSLSLPAFTTTQGAFSSVVQLGNLSGATTLTLTAQPGLFNGMQTVVPNTQTIFYALQIPSAASPVVTPNAGLTCGSPTCSLVVLTIPAATVTAAGTSKFYVEECTLAACPTSATNIVQITPNASNQIIVTPAQLGSDVKTLDPTNPTYFIFSYASVPPV